MSFMQKFEENIGKFALALGTNKYVSTIKNSFIAIIPFTIAGSLAVLIGSVLFRDHMLGGISGLEFLQDIEPLFSAINYGAMNIMAVMIAYYVGYHLAREFNVDNPVYAGMISLSSYVILVPTQVLLDVGEVNNVLSNDVTGAKGLFVALVGGMLATRFYVWLMSFDKLRIKLPDAVPENVGNSFSALIPTIVVLFTVGTVGFLFQMILGFNFYEFIAVALQGPLEAMMQHPLGIVGGVLFTHTLWIFGIHGSSIFNGLTDPMLLSALSTNTNLVAEGLEATEIVTRPFWNMYATMGGVGNTLALIVAILVISKRDDERAISKLAIGPGLFGINEPITFGLPIVLNPIYAIPFILAPTVTVLIGYFATYTGFAAKAFVAIPWSLPPFVNAFIATGGDFGAVITQFIGLVATFLIYLPFVRISSRQYQAKLAEESKSK